MSCLAVDQAKTSNKITKVGAMTTIAPKAELNKLRAPKIKLILVVFPNEISLISFELDTKFGEGTPPLSFGQNPK